MSSDRFAEEFKALGTTTLLDLALFLPQSFEDNIICKTPKNQKNCVVSFTPKSKKRNGSMLHIDGWCETWQMPLRCNIFNAKPYHNAIFKLDTPLYVAGKCEFGYSRWQITQPRVVKNIGTITPKYKSDLKNQDVIRLVEELLSVERLFLCGLKKDDATLLHSLHVQPFDESIYEQKILPLLKKVEILNYLQKLSVKKVQHKTKIRLNGEVQNFINSLPFQLTNDQLKAVWDIKKDFVGEFASKRIVMGDVGCGKTMVILCAFMLCYPNRGVLLAPTTILATQLFEEAKRYLPLHVQLAFVSSSAKIGDINSANVIIGTHALLYEKLENVSLVMVDEQHRFGTAQRNALRNFGDNPHFLQFSATPIPRTLGMINTTLVDYSFIKELPFEKNIQTKVIHKEDFSHLLNHIKIQIDQNHQIAIIHPKIAQSDSNKYKSPQ